MQRGTPLPVCVGVVGVRVGFRAGIRVCKRACVWVCRRACVMRACVCACVCVVCVCACVCMYLHVCMYVHVCVCVCLVLPKGNIMVCDAVMYGMLWCRSLACCLVVHTQTHADIQCALSHRGPPVRHQFSQRGIL